MKNLLSFKQAILIVVLATILSVSGVYSQQYTLQDDDVVVENGIITSCSYNFALKDIVIPQTLDGQTVTGIKNGGGVFNYRSLTSVVLPSTIESIGSFAFERNSFLALDLSGCTSLKSIGDNAFSSNSIGSLDFYNCTNLISIGNYAFSSNSIGSLDFSNCTNLTSIGNSAFSSNSISSLDFSNCTNLTSIGDYAFSDNLLTALDLSDCSTLLFLGDHAFYGNNSLTGYHLPEVSYNGTIYTLWKDGKGNSYTAGINQVSDFSTFYLPFIPYTLKDEDVVVENGIITSCSYNFDLKNIIIPQTLDGQTVTGIKNGGGVFNYRSLTSVVLPSTIESIGSFAFERNSFLALDLSDCISLKSIADDAFSSNSIGSLDFSNCTNLTSIGNSAFSSNSIGSLDFSNCANLTSIGNSAFSSNSISSLDFSNCTNLTSIGDYAFSDNLLTGLDLSDCSTLLFLGDHAFYGNNSLTGFHLPEVSYDGTIYTLWKDGKGNSYTAGINQVSDFNTFYLPFIPYTLKDEDVVVENGIITSCSYNFDLKNIIIPQTLDGQTVTGIKNGGGVFNYRSLTSVVLPSTIESIGSFAFEGNRLSTLDLTGCPSLKSIGDYAFRDDKISTLNLSASNQINIIGDYAFFSNSIGSLDFSNCSNLTSIGNSAFSSNSIGSLDFSNCTNLTSIEDYAFSSNHVASLDLSDCSGLKNIGENSFVSNSIASLNINGCTSLLNIGNRAFYNNPLSGFTLPEIAYNGITYTIWKDGKNSSYTAGVNPATDLNTFYLPYIQYTLTNKDVVVENGIITSCSYDFELNNIIIPQVLDGQTVIGIANASFSSGVFYDKKIASIELPSTIETIGDYAFYSNRISVIDFSVCPVLSKIGKYAFYNNFLISLDINDCVSLTYLGEYVFSSNSAISQFTLPKTTILNYFYSYWIDGNSVTHTASELVTNLSISYSRVMPVISDVTPVYSPTAGNIEITITGAKFENDRNNKKILFNGIETIDYTEWSDNLIRVVCPPNPAGNGEICIVLENDLKYKSPKSIFYSDDNIEVACGNVSGTWSSGKTYLLSCPVSILAGETLIIESGVKVAAMAGQDILITCNGIIETHGTKSDPVIFTSTTKIPGSWKGITIYGTYDNCKFNYTTFEYASKALSLYGEAYGCTSYSNESKFTNCIIKDNSYDGFYCMGTGDDFFGCSMPKTGATSPLIQNCMIYNNGNNGIELVAYDGYMSNGFIGARIYNSLIYNNENGIYSYGSDNVEPDIINNVFSKNNNSAIRSTQSVFNSDYYLIANNIISDNGAGIINESTNAIKLYNNGFWDNSPDLKGEFQEESDISGDPIFVDFQNNDFNIQPGSPYIDAGSNNFVDFEIDFLGNNRIVDGLGGGISTVDIGAYEFNSYFVGVNENEMPGILRNYPNPTRGIVTLEGLPMNGRVRITVSNISGKVILDFINTGTNAVIDLSEEEPGIYLINLNRQRQKTLKVIKE